MINATKADVVACYRLILGREPDEGGARNYFSLISNEDFPLDALVDTFLSSSEFLHIQSLKEAAASRVEAVEIDGFRMTVVPDWNSINKAIATHRHYEPHVAVHVKNLLKPNMVFVDIGANIGYYALLAASRGAKVYALEPNTRNIWLLGQSARDNGFDIKIFPYALADTERLVLYNPLRGNGQVTDLPTSLPSEAQQILRSMTLDGVLEGVSPDMVKIDVEGSEGLVLQGAQHTLDSRPIVISEFTTDVLPAISRVSPQEYLDEFVRRGYTLHVCEMDLSMREVSTDELVQASISGETTLVDFIAIPPPEGADNRPALMRLLDGGS